MVCSVANVKRHLRILLLLCASALTFGGVSIAYAQDTTVNLAICGSGAGATLTIDLPINDSVVDQSPVQVSGTVSNATQIEVKVDGQYNATIPLTPGQTNYATSVQLQSGTHTISLIAFDVCHVQDANASVIVTYQPQSNPGGGGSTPTEVDNGGGAVVQTTPITAEDDKKTGLDTWPVIGPLIRLGHDMIVALDFEIESRPGTLWQSMLRFSFIVLGISAVFFGNIALSIWNSWRGPVSSTKIWLLRGFGAVLLVIAFII